MTPVTAKQKGGGGLWTQTMAKILRYIVEFYTAYIILNKQQNKFMVITSNCVKRKIGVKGFIRDRHRWNVKHGYKFGGRDVSKFMEVYLDFDMQHFCVAFKN